MRPSLLPLAALAALAALVGCSSSDDAQGCTPGSTVEVGAKDELKFNADSYESGSGCVEFTYTNQGSTAHTLLIKNVKDFKLAVGDKDTGTAELEPGTYTLYCDLPGHEAAGMEAELTVS